MTRINDVYKLVTYQKMHKDQSCSIIFHHFVQFGSRFGNPDLTLLDSRYNEIHFEVFLL